MLKLRRVTLVYDSAEDRIQMRGASDVEDVYSFWLTLRMSREIVKAITGHLEKVQGARTPGPQKDSVQRSLHSGAKTAMRRSKPVGYRTSTDSRLLSSVTLRVTDRSILLKLPMEDKKQAVLPLTFNEARQWLEILYQQFKKAEWPLDNWPAWIEGSSEAKRDRARDQLH